MEKTAANCSKATSLFTCGSLLPSTDLNDFSALITLTLVSHLESQRKSLLSPSALHTSHSLKEGWQSIRVPSLRLTCKHKLYRNRLKMLRYNKLVCQFCQKKYTILLKFWAVCLFCYNSIAKETYIYKVIAKTNAQLKLWNKSLNHYVPSQSYRVLPWIQPGCLISAGSPSTPAPPSHCLRSAPWTFVRQSVGAEKPAPHLAPEAPVQRPLYPESSHNTSAGTPVRFL